MIVFFLQALVSITRATSDAQLPSLNRLRRHPPKRVKGLIAVEASAFESATSSTTNAHETKHTSQENFGSSRKLRFEILFRWRIKKSENVSEFPNFSLDFKIPDTIGSPEHGVGDEVRRRTVGKIRFLVSASKCSLRIFFTLSTFSSFVLCFRKLGRNQTP